MAPKRFRREQCRPERRSVRPINVCERTDEPWRLPAEVMCRVQREKTWYSAQRGCIPVTVPGPKWKSWLDLPRPRRRIALGPYRFPLRSLQGVDKQLSQSLVLWSARGGVAFIAVLRRYLGRGKGLSNGFQRTLDHIRSIADSEVQSRLRVGRRLMRDTRPPSISRPCWAS